MKIFLSADSNMTNPNNIISNEIHENIIEDSLIVLNHDIFFKNNLSIYDIGNDNNIKLVLGTDYSLEAIDALSTDISGKQCYHKIKFKKPFSKISVNYHAYGDFVSSEVLNEICQKIEGLIVGDEHYRGKINLESSLPATGNVNGDSFGISNCDISAPGFPGISKWNEVTNKWDIYPDKTLIIDDDTIINNGINKIEVNRDLFVSQEDYENDITDKEDGLISRVENIEETLNTQDSGVVDRLKTVENTLNNTSVGVIDRLEVVEGTLNSQTTGIVDRVEDLENTLNTQDSGIVDMLTSIEETVNGDQKNLGLSARVTDLESADTLFTQKLQAHKGYGGFLEPHDFGTNTPTQEQLTNYALSEINIIDHLEIFNGTHVKNIYVNPNINENPDQTPDNNVWVLTNTPDTTPPVFEWINDGPSGISNASNTRYGVMKGVVINDDGTTDGFITFDETGKPKTIGFTKLKTETANKIKDIKNTLDGDEIESGLISKVDDLDNKQEPFKYFSRIYSSAFDCIDIILDEGNAGFFRKGSVKIVTVHGPIAQSYKTW